jgi:hypothetical protein
MYDSEVMCRKEVDTPWSIYQDFTVFKETYYYYLKFDSAHFGMG